MSSWDDDADPVDENATGIESNGDFSDFSDSEFSDLPSDDEVFDSLEYPVDTGVSDVSGDYDNDAPGPDSHGDTPADDHLDSEPGMGITTWDPDADDEYLGGDSTPTPDHVAGEGLVDEFGEYDPSRGDDAPQPPPVVVPDSSVGWAVWVGLAIAAVLLVGGAGAGAWYFTKDSSDEPQAGPETSESIAEWPSEVATPPGGAGGATEDADMSAVVASLEADRNRLAAENDKLRANESETKTSTRTETRTETRTHTNTSTSTLPAPPARTVTHTAPAPAPRVVTNTVTAAAPPPRVVTNTVTATETISGGRVTVTRTIITRP